MEPNTAIADHNTERLIRTAYQPEQAPAEFVASMAMKMTETAKVLAQKQPPPPKPQDERSDSWGSRRPRPWRRVALVIGGMAACALVLFALAPFFQQRPREEKNHPVQPDQAKQQEPAPKKPTDADTPQPIPASTVQLAKWTDDVRDGMMPRIRPAAPALPILKDGEKVVTKAGQRRLVQLADGTRLYVNEKTEVEVTAARQLALRSGQIYLEIAPQEKASNFVVKTAGRELTATGTHFAVEADATTAGVIVTQGKVAVKGIEKEIAAGQQIAAGETAITSAPRATHTLAWTRDLMAAAETPMVPACQHAGGELIALDPQGQEIKLALRIYHIDVHIEDGFARTTIDQTYFNTTWERLEGTFYFPLPADASLSRLAMYVNDGNNQMKLMEGGMAERKHAADVYETIRYMRRDPALLEWLDGSTFKMRVFPLEAKQEKRIILSYTQKLPSLYGGARYRFSGGLNMPVVRDWSFNCRIKSGAGMTVWSPTVPDVMIIPQGGDVLVRHFANHVKPAADVTIEMMDKTAVADNDVPRFAATLADNQQYVMLRYRPTLPSLPERQRRDWIVLFESSAQRDPLLAGTQVDVLRNLLKNAEYDDTFVLLTANSKTQIFDEKPRAANPANVAAALKFLESAHLVGALDLEKGLEAALKFAKSAKNPHILHVGSGIPAMGQRDAGKLAQLLPEGVPYVGVGVGKRWNRSFMKAAAERTNGLFTQINPDEVVAWRAFELLATLNTPRLLNVQVLDPASVDGEPRFLSETTMIAQGEEICAVMRGPTNKGVVPGKVVIKGTLAGKPFVKEVPVVNVLSGAGYLPRIWAKLEIDRLLALDSAKHKAEIIALSKALYVMSPFTSLLVLETDADYETYKVDRGRKDHWAMYQCPPKIPQVYEPEGKPPVKEEKPEAKKGGKPAVGEVLATMASLDRYQRLLAERERTLELYRRGAIDKETFDSLARVRETRTGSLMLGAGAEKPFLETFGGKFEARESDRDSWLDRAAWSQRMVKKGFHSRSQAEADQARLRDMEDAPIQFPADWKEMAARRMSKQPPADPAVYFPPLTTWKALSKPRKDKYEVADPPSYVGEVIIVGNKVTQDRIRRTFAGVAPGQVLTPELKIAEANLARLGGFGASPDGEAGLIPAPAPFSHPRYDDGGVYVGLEGVLYSTNRSLRDARTLSLPAPLPTELSLQSPASVDFYPPALSLILRDQSRVHTSINGGLIGEKLKRVEADREKAGLANLTVADASNAMIEATRQTSPLYQRPQLGYDRSYFTDLLQYAPGLSTAWADVLATLEEEADVAEPKLGKIDPAARKLIDKARAADWQSLSIAAQGPIPGYKIHYNGIGQFTYERILGSGLCEKVVCDGKTLHHLYPEIGLASKRSFSRHHHDLAEAIDPAFLPAIEELARGCDIQAIDGNTIAIVPIWAAELKKDTQYARVHLIFAKDGRLSERRIVEHPAGKILVRQIFHAAGDVEWQDGEGKSLAKLPRTVERAKAPSLTPDVGELVVIKLPIRTPEHIIASAKKRDVDPDRDLAVAHDCFIAFSFAGNPLADSGRKLARLFEEPRNRKLGYYVLLNAVDANYAIVNSASEKLVKADVIKQWQPLDPRSERPKSALAIFVARTQLAVIGDANADALLPQLPGPKDGFIQKLGRCRDLWLAWQNQRPIQNPAELPIFKAKVMDLLQETTSPVFAYAVLDTMQRRCNIAPTDRMMELAVKRFGPITSPVGLGYIGRYEFARSLYQAGLSAEAGKQFRELYADTLKLGVLPPIDADFRAALQSKEFIGFIRTSADGLIEKKRFGLAFQVAAQMDQLGDEALCDEVLSAILTRASDKERNAVTLVSVQFQAQRKNFAQADRLLGKLLADKELAQYPELWRGRSDIAKQLGQTAESVRCLEKALDLEFAELPEIVNLERFRADYRVILEHYQRVAEASALLEKPAPKAFLAKVIRTADRWRLVDPDAAEPCKLAGRILATAGERELAWDYWTTPIDLHPAESKPWVELAETLQSEGDLERADRAYALGFEAEPTNPEILWKRAQNLARLGQPEQARALYRQIADRTWQDRFRATAEQARGLAGK